MTIDAPDSPTPDVCRPDEETVEPRRQYVTETTTPVGAVTLDSSHHNEGDREDDRQRTAKSAATTLEILGDLPDMDAKPPENVLFVCKLNPVTDEEALELIFSRFGEVISASIVRDFKTGDSLCYAFVEFAEKSDAEEAYFKCDGILVDDRRIRVDFSQSIAKDWDKWRHRWRSFKRKAPLPPPPQAPLPLPPQAPLADASADLKVLPHNIHSADDPEYRGNESAPARDTRERHSRRRRRSRQGSRSEHSRHGSRSERRHHRHHHEHHERREHRHRRHSNDGEHSSRHRRRHRYRHRYEHEHEHQHEHENVERKRRKLHS